MAGMNIGAGPRQMYEIAQMMDTHSPEQISRVVKVKVHVVRRLIDGLKAKKIKYTKPGAGSAKKGKPRLGITEANQALAVENEEMRAQMAEMQMKLDAIMSQSKTNGVADTVDPTAKAASSGTEAPKVEVATAKK